MINFEQANAGWEGEVHLEPYQSSMMELFSEKK